nr:hypothetical protein [uncultured Flavobacterium sp.]
MNILLNKAYLFFFLIIPLILAVSFYKPKETFDVNIGDTYYVIKNSHLGIILSVLYLIPGIVYYFLIKNNIQLSNWIVCFHTILSIGGLIVIWLILKKINHSHQNFEEILKTIKVNMYLTYVNIVVFFSIIFVQIIFLINVTSKLIKS